jgi:hypothetical protein
VEVCVAKPNVLRCFGSFLFPFAALGAYAYKIASVGVHDVQAYLLSLTSDGSNAASALFFFGGSLAWVLITWPKARAALKSGRCAISVGTYRLRLYGETVERLEIARVDVVRRPFDVQLRVRRTDGSVTSKSITLLSPSPVAIAAALREQGL